MTLANTRRILCSLILVPTLTLASAASGEAILIDDFNDGNGIVMAGPGGSDMSIDNPATGAVGGMRDLFIPDVVLPPVSGIGSLTVAANPFGSGLLSFSLDAMTSGSGRLVWDGDGSGLGGVDFTDGGASKGIGVSIIDIDQGDVDLMFGVSDTSGNVAELLLLNTGAGMQQFVYDDFTPVVGVVDFTQIDSAFLAIAGRDGSDLLIDQIATLRPVPEPSSLALAVIGAASMIAVRRRRARR